MIVQNAFTGDMISSLVISLTGDASEYGKIIVCVYIYICNNSKIHILRYVLRKTTICYSIIL